MSASDENSLSKPGPKTAAGKRRSSRNSRTHGIFSRQLIFAADEESQFGEMRDRLRKDLAPCAAIEELFFDNLAACAWRLACALHLEQSELQREVSREPNISIELAPTDSASDRLANFGHLEIRRRYKLLNELRTDIEKHGGPSSELEKPVTEIFGTEYWQLLKKWEVIGWYTLREFTKFNALQDPDSSLPPPDLEEHKKNMAIESHVRYQMILKLVDLELHHLLRAGREFESRANSLARQGERLELFLRYETKARRDFYRAFAEYMAATKLVSEQQK